CASLSNSFWSGLGYLDYW
nr:immunoglobulin heavy chain junction region [Macaca mulatta]MOW75216.1 immunoglobulin heavy chain junction region [Macaca mulatta]MOW76731.1 immunoglobulin heavy chain junction region [Macaca mulatta]MOW77517.1 immunoglobulin heavy chain junction region [Macaca mulatta]MOW78268.1 immunoglobulin heavy chain junction region [Macaca mulatta]